MICALPSVLALSEDLLSNPLVFTPRRQLFPGKHRFIGRSLEPSPRSRDIGFNYESSCDCGVEGFRPTSEHCLGAQRVSITLSSTEFFCPANLTFMRLASMMDMAQRAVKFALLYTTARHTPRIYFYVVELCHPGTPGCSNPCIRWLWMRYVRIVRCSCKTLCSTMHVCFTPPDSLLDSR